MFRWALVWLHVAAWGKLPFQGYARTNLIVNTPMQTGATTGDFLWRINYLLDAQEATIFRPVPSLICRDAYEG